MREMMLRETKQNEAKPSCWFGVGHSQNVLCLSPWESQVSLVWHWNYI